ncbi:MAG: MotA/TolQ/ExbB proton channel family protein [Patescibacteria group bacterium]
MKGKLLNLLYITYLPLAYLSVKTFELISIFKKLSDQGFIVYLTGFLFCMALHHLLLTCEKQKFNAFCEMIPMSGFLGTVIGLIQQIDLLASGSSSKEGLIVALLTTGQGLILVMVLQLIKMLLPKKMKDGITAESPK